jgi:hypothetical protein
MADSFSAFALNIPVTSQDQLDFWKWKNTELPHTGVFFPDNGKSVNLGAAFESADIEETCGAVHEYLKKFNLDDTLTFTLVCWCSKLRPEEHGSVSVAINRHRILTRASTEVEAALAAELDLPAPDASPHG